MEEKAEAVRVSADRVCDERLAWSEHIVKTSQALSTTNAKRPKVESFGDNPGEY